MKIKAAIFDVDGTIIDSMGEWYTVGEKYVKSLGIEPEKGLGDKLFRITLDMGVDYIFENYDTGKSRDDIKSGIKEIMDDYYMNESQLKEHAVEILDKLKGKGIKMVVATSTDRDYIEAAFKRLKVDGYFDRIYTCPEVGKTKSEPHIFYEALKFLKTSVEETWVFEDGLYSIKTAKKEGFKIAGVYDEVSEKDQKEIEEYSDLYLKNLKDFSQVIIEE